MSEVDRTLVRARILSRYGMWKGVARLWDLVGCACRLAICSRHPNNEFLVDRQGLPGWNVQLLTASFRVGTDTFWILATAIWPSGSKKIAASKFFSLAFKGTAQAKARLSAVLSKWQSLALLPARCVLFGLIACERESLLMVLPKKAGLPPGLSSLQLSSIMLPRYPSKTRFETFPKTRRSQSSTTQSGRSDCRQARCCS